MADLASVWVFHGLGGRFASGTFTSKEKAEQWIRANDLQGTLTEYPLDIGVYQWAVERGVFRPSEDEHFGSDFIQEFSTAHQLHYHYERDDR